MVSSASESLKYLNENKDLKKENSVIQSNKLIFSLKNMYD